MLVQFMKSYLNQKMHVQSTPALKEDNPTKGDKWIQEKEDQVTVRVVGVVESVQEADYSRPQEETF